MKKKKILCIIGQLGNGGSEKQLYLFLKHLNRNMFDPQVLVSSGSYIEKWKRLFELELKVPVYSMGKTPSLLKLLSFKRFISKFTPDLIFSWSFYTNPFVMLSRGIPFIGSLRGGIDEEREVLNSIHFKFSLKPALFVVNSKKLLSELINEGIEKNKIVLIKNIYQRREKEAISQDVWETREKYGIPQASVLIAGGGRNSSAKDFPFWLECFRQALAINPNLRGILFGHGPPAILKDKISKHGLDDKIVLTGDLPSIDEILRASDIFFLSSIYEGLPNVLLEAIEAGCSILSTDTAGVRDIFEGNDELLSKVMPSGRESRSFASRLATIAEIKQKGGNLGSVAESLLTKLDPQVIMPSYMNLIELAIAKMAK
jgi:glycosyltransferase involved in cell wall biosynthesis